MRQYFESQIDPKFNVTLHQIVKMNQNRIDNCSIGKKPNLISIDRVGRQKVYFMLRRLGINDLNGFKSVSLEVLSEWDDKIDELKQYEFVRFENSMPLFKEVHNEPTVER